MTLIERWVFWSFWKVGQGNMMYSSRDLKTFEISFCKAGKKKDIKIFSGYFRLFEKHAYLKTSIVNPSLHSFWGIKQLNSWLLTRYKKSCNLVIIRPLKLKKCFLGHFRLSEGYTYLRLFIVMSTKFLRRQQFAR